MQNFLNEPFGGLDLLSSSIILVDGQLAVRFINSSAENLLALSRKSVDGQKLDDIVSIPESLKQVLHNVLAQRWGYTGQNIEITRPDGSTLHLNCTVNPVDPHEVHHIPDTWLLLELWPIDQQLKATREERLLEQQAASRELIRNLAHEIKNPLGGIRGAAQLLEHELNNASLREYTQVIINEADRLQDLMKRLLSPHRPMQPSPVNIHEILERVRSLLSAEFPETLKVRRDYDTSLPDLIGDREKLIQAILNIARNAAQAIQGEPGRAPQSGLITLKTRIARQMTLAKKRFPLVAELQIIDNGPGIPAHIKDKMFYPLVSGRDNGSGLGLTLAQSFVLQHQGTIECDSTPGHTCFTIRLPIDRNKGVNSDITSTND